MADIRANQVKLYKALQGVGFKDLGSEEQFAAKLQDAGNRQKLYKALEKQGFKDLGDYDSFENRIYDGSKQTTVFQSSLQQRMYPNGQVFTEPIKREEAQPKPQQQPAKVEQPKQSQQTKQEPAGAYKPTWQEQWDFGSTLGGAQYAVDNATKGIDQMEQASKQASPFGSGNVGIGNNQSLRKSKQTFDAEKGAFVDTYLTSDGREFRDLQQANNAQEELDNISGNIRYQEAMKQLGVTDIASEQDKDINQRLKEAYAERMELQRMLSEENKKGDLSVAMRSDPMMGITADESHRKNANRFNLESALRLLERRITALEAERDDEGQSMFWRGTTDTLKDPSAYSLGLTDLADTGVMSQLKSKIDAAGGDLSKLSGSEKALVRNYLMNQEAQRLNENRGNMYGFGQMFGQSLPFMAEFYLTGGFMGLGQAGTRLGTKAGLRMAGSELGKQMTKNLGGRILLKTGQSVLKGAGRVGGALAGGALQSNTIGAAKTYSDIANRNIGNLTLNDKGNLDFKDSEGIAEAFLKGQLTNAFENGSELLGPAFDFAPNYLARVIKNKVAGGAVNKLLSNKAWRGTNKVLRKFGVQGLFGEGMEEEANNIGNVLIGESNWFKDPNDPNKPAFFDGEEQFKTWAGVALTGAVLRGPAIAAGGYQKAQYYANKYNLNASDNQMSSVLGDYDRYQSIKSMLDGATNENIGSVLNKIMNGGQLNDQEKEAVVFYAQDLVNLRGFNIGSVVAEAVGAQPQPRVASYQVKADGKSFDELDKDGNVLAHHEYETNDEMKAGLYELQQQRFDENLQSDISIMKTRPNGQFDQLVSDYLMQNELFMMPSDFEAILNKPSLERTDDEQQLVAPFSELLHNTVYDNTMLHEEQSQQDGEEIADADSIDIEAGGEQGAAINAEWQAAQQARNELFSRNEELAQEVLSRENNGLSHQEIISSLTTFRPEDVQAVIDFYNKKARYEGYINRKAQKIDEAAANSRQRHTMKGTIDGVADLNNVHTITDGTNRYYLVSGDITTDPATGRITGSTSGLIIGMDLDGSFVNLNESDGYSLEPVTMTLDQFEEAERTRLQEQITEVIDPNGLMNPQTEQPSEGSGQPVRTARTESPNSPDAVQGADTTGQAGAEAGASTGTGANEAPAALSSEPQQPQVTIESVTDKDGIKRYENGIAVDDAIADIIASGDDVNEIADASIAEAQEVIGKINNKQIKTRLDIEKRKNAQRIIDYYNNVKARWAEMNAEAQPAESEENVNNQPEQPIIEEKPVSSQQNKSKAKTANEKQAERIKALKEQYGDDFDDDFTYAQTAEELASMYVGRNRTLSREDLARELGYPLGLGTDEVWAETLLAKKGEGLSTWDVAHAAWQSDENPIIDNEGNRKFDDQEIHNALISVFQNAKQKSDIMDYAINAREEAARQKAEGRKRQEEEEAQELQPLEPLTAEEIAKMEAKMPFAQSTDEEIEDAPINQLRREIEALTQEGSMPPIQLVDTERMTNDEWVEFLSDMMGYFLSQEEVNQYVDTIINDGVYYNPETGNIIVFSGNQTPEEVRAKVEQIKEELGNGRSTEEENGGLETEVIQRPSTRNAQQDSAETEGETGSTSTAGEGSTEPVVDDYLQPRNAEEEKIISDVDNQLKGEIFAQQLAVGKAKQKWDSETAKVNQRPEAGLFGDNIEKREKQAGDQLEAFEGDNAPAVDASEENLRKQVKQYEDAYQHEKQKLEKLQSEQERNSRVRGALDNYRRQTKIETDNPIEAIEQAAQSFAQEQQETINKRKERWQGKKEPAYGADNKLVTTDRYEELKKRMKEKLRGQANMGFDPEILAIGTEMAVYHIEAGARKFTEFAQHMIEELGDAIRPYLKAIYNGAREMPGMEELRKQMTSYESVSLIDVQNIPNTNDNTVNVNKKENNEPENVVSSQQETINNNNNGQQENQSVGGQTAASNNPTHGESPRPTSHVGQGTVGQGLQNGGPQQQGSSRVSQLPGGNSGSGGRSDRRLQGLNKNNNHEERGTESAPSTPRMRTQANIEAIRLMQQIVEEDRPATDEEKKILRMFSGWGGLGVAFEDPTYSEELRSLLGDAAYDQAQMSRNSAYFTPANIIDAMWDIAKALGFKGGNVLEGSAGIGKIIGLMPSELSDSSNIQAVEIDETTGNILKLLYPDAQVDIQGFEDTKIPNGSIDLAITNVPFVTGLRVQDTTGDKDLSKKFHDIHDFCIAKNIRKLREGGIGIFITSNGTLDNSQKLRDWIISEGDADVVGAFRLNNKTFGGTGTTSDIIVVRKRVNGQKSPNAIDVSLPSAVRGAEYDTGETKKVKGQEVPVIKKLSMDYNGYFVEHPEHMGGEMVFNFEIGETYRPTSKTLTPGKVNQDERLNAWVDEMSKKDWSKEASAETSEPEKPQYEKYGEGVKEGSLILDSKGNICIAQYGEAVPLGVNDKKVKGRSKQECLKDYNAIKNALNEVLNYQVEHEGDEGLQPLLDKLNKAYNQFVAKYGHFHNNTAIAFLRNDVDYASVGALETYKEKTDKDGNKTPVYGKADVFSKRVVEKEKEPQPKTIEDGVIASIYKYNGINIPYIAQQLGMTEEEAKEEILDKGLGFENPDTTQVEVNYVYLSGNVREKLEKAKANNANGKYAKNISALEKIIPDDIPAHLIEFNLGSTWIDKELYKEFFKEKTGKNATFNDANGTWFLGYNEEYTPKDAEGAVFSELCDKTILTSQLIEAAMTGRTIKVQKTEKGWDGKTETITDNEATQACAARIDELKQDFKDWARAKIQSDPEMAEKAEKAYNEKFNNYVPMTIPDEFAPSHFGGQVTKLGGKPFKLRPHQSKAVIKGITQPVLFAHEVGTGKTFTLITTAMEMRRIGTAKKPMIVVQNATVGQFTESAKMLYPNAKILTMDEKDHSESARKQFYAKIKYNDWDLIIVPQSVLDKIPDSPDRQLAYINEKIQEKERILMLLEEDPANWAIVNRLRKELDEMYDEEYNLTEASAARSEKKKKRDEKKRAVAKQNAAVRAKEQLDRSVDDVEDFDDMEIDAILVDEAHGYKKLGFGSVMQRVKGVDTGSSKKCASLLLKTRAVLEKSHGKNVVFATGTPVSNTAAEVWTFMRYLMPEETMEEYGIKFFDDFARNFGNVQQMLEFTTSGKFKENNRFAGYVNMPELARIWRSVADIVLTKEAGAVQEAIPELEGGKATDIYLPQTKALRAVMKYVRQELERYEHMTGKEKKANSYIPLVMYGIAKAAAVDARLVDSTAADEPQSKTNEAVRQALRSLEETKEYNGTIAIFADNYQNKQSGFNLYEDIKKKLVAQGVPSEQIAIIRSDMSDKKKLDIFDKVNSGEIRVVMGSTQTLGTGVNIQERLHTLIHMDAPNRPMDYTQRNGRELRQGNLHREWGIPVRILRFGVEDSLDVTAYQRLKTKGAIADSVMNAKKLMDNAMDSRVLEEEEDVFGDTVAQLSGSEYAMLKNQAEKEVRKLEARYKQWEADQIFVHAQMPRLLGQSDASKLRMEKAEKNLATVEKAMKEPLKIEINGKSYDSLEAMADFFKDYNSKIKAVEDEIRKSGVVQGQERKLTITINGIPFEFKTIITGSRSHEKGQIKFSTMRQTTFNNEDLIGSERNAKGGYIKNGVEEILNDYLSGNDYREIIETEKNSIARNEAQIKMLEERSGKEFTEGEALEKARERLEEYTQKMKEEMAAKEAKYKEMDSEVEASDSVTMSDEDEESDAPKRMITTSDPMRAIEQAADSWRSEKGRSLLQQIADFVSDIPARFGLKGAAPTYVVNSREDLESLKNIVSKEVFDKIEELYNEPDTGSAYLPKGDIVVIFGEHLDSVDEAEEAWWHEQVHAFWGRMPNDARDRIGQACYEWLRANRPDIYMHIRTEYKDSERLEESCAFFIGNVIVSRIGTERLLNNNLENSEEIRTFANKLTNHLQNGREEKGSNQPGRAGESGQTSTTQVRRGISQERERRDNSSRSETESELQEVTDPIRAIELSAKRWKKRKAEREEDIKALDEYSAKQVYHDRIDRVETMFAESWQDDMVTFKAGQDAIAHGKDIPDSQNAYMAANLAHGKVYNEQEKFTNFFKNPLIEAINKILKATGWRMGDIDRYVFTKHGLERNREFYVRDFMNSLRSKTIRSIEDLNEDEQEIFRKKEEKLHEQFDDGTIETEEELNKKLTKALKDAHSEYMNNLQEEYDKIKQDRYVNLQEGKITFPEYLSAIDDFIFSNIDGDYVPEEHDYSGFTEMYGDEEGNYNENAIIEELMVNEEVMGEGNMKELWNRINLISAYGLDSYRKSGMTSDDTSKRISNMFHWYVPMRGFGNSQAAEDHWQYMTHNDGQAAHIGGLLKSAKGRKSEANYPIATLIGMTLKAIGDCEQNMVKQKLWRLCQANPNDLIVTSEAWVVLDPVSGEWVTDYPEIDSDMTVQMVEAKVKEFMERMRALELEGNAKRIKGKEHFDYKVDSKKRSEHVIEVKLNGERKLMIVTGNPRMALAINGQLRYEGGKSIFAKVNTAMKQFMQSMSTSFNLTFVGRNMMRDLTHFTAILAVREGAGYTAAAEKYYMAQLPKMKSLFKKYRENTLDESKEMERDFKDFMDNGGITGFVHMQKVEKYQKEMEKLFKDKNAGKPIKVNNKVWDYTLGAIEAMNEAIENNARFATYRASRHYAGRTKARSAYDAKEVTVNFNKKGAGRKTADFKSDKMKVRAAAKTFGSTGQVLAANKMFFNATIQAICTIFKNFQNKDGSINWPYVGKFVSLYAAPQFAMGLLMPFINDMLLAVAGGDDGDDPYANLPEWVRRKNLCIYLGWVPGCGKNDFLLIPLGQELAAFYSLGDMAAGLTYKPNIRPLDRSLDDEILGFFSVFSPVDFDTKVTDNEHFAPVSEYVGRVSSVAAPLVAIGENTSWMGRPIFRSDKYPDEKYVPEYQMVFSNTNAQFVQFSEWLNNISGGDDVSRGVIQINPATMQYLVEQYTGGPGKFFANTLVSAGKDAKEFITSGEAPDFNIRKIEGVRAFYQQSDERNQFYRTQAKYRKYREDAQEVGYKIRRYGEDAAVNPEHYMQLNKLLTGKDAVRYNLLFGQGKYDKALRELNTKANEATGNERKNLRALYNQLLKNIVDELDEIRDIPEASNQ